MAKIIIQTYCLGTSNGGYDQHDVYYETGLKGAYPITEVVTPTITCAPYTIPNDTELEHYCALDANGKGVRRTIKTVQDARYYYFVDTDDSACNGTCDLYVTYSATNATSTPALSDGKINIGGSTSKPPLTCYIAGAGVDGWPTTTTPISAPGVFPALFDFEFTGVAAGTYGVQLQDFGNCNKGINGITVAKGGATSNYISAGLPKGYIWFKYEVRRSTTNGGGDESTISGYAWNPDTRVGYFTGLIPLTFPAFYNRRNYAKGEVVSWIPDGQDVRFYYQAAQDLLQSDSRFDGDDHRIPNPHQDNVDAGYWEYVTQRYDYFVEYLYKGSLMYNIFEPFFQKKTSLPGGDYHYYYPEGTVVRYDWAGFYRAKKGLESNLFPASTLPAPTVGASNDNWEKVEGYDALYYVAAEADIIYQYDIGTINRRVRFHAFNPDEPNYVPTSSSWFQNSDGDYILFDDVEPGVETNLGDLRVIGTIKNDIDTPGAENGSVWILTETPSPPVRYHLRNGVRAGYQQDNTTGQYENLHAGDFVVDIYDANDRYVTTEFTIEDRYRPRWRIAFPDTRQEAVEALIYQQDWDGEITDVTGTDSPIDLSWAPGGDNLDDDLPVAVGAILDLSMYREVVQQFVATIEKDDRNHRADLTVGGQLKFRGYLDTKQYRESMLAGPQRVNLSFTDGLGQLSKTKWVDLDGLTRLTGRASMLWVVLKCLSLCDTNLPVYCGLNLRDKLMRADADPLSEAYIHLNVFDKKDSKVKAVDDFIDVRTVLDGVLRGFNAFLCQADGCWKIISPSEAHTDYAVRAWSPAGTLLTGVDTSALPVRVLPDQDATGPNELYWINGAQENEAISAAQLIQASVKLQLEPSLFRNGDFVEWDGTNKRPSYWTVEGAPTITRDKGEKAKEYAVKFAKYQTYISPNAGLLSPPAPHIADPQEEDGMQVKFKATLEHTTTNPAEMKATLYFQVVCNGADFGAPYPIEISTKDKWKEYTIDLRTGMPGNSVRVRILPPVAADTDSVATTVRINYVYISIRPGLVDWSDVDEDTVTLINEDAKTGIMLSQVELALADLPQLADSNSNPLPPKKMDVYAWRHAISLKDFTPTTGWARPGFLKYTPFLDNAAQDRMALRAVPARVVTGEVAGPAMHRLRVGLMIDMPEDFDGKYLLTDVNIDVHNASATIIARKLADGYFGGVEEEIPDHVRIATKNGKTGYRIAFVNGIEGYRIANK